MWSFNIKHTPGVTEPPNSLLIHFLQITKKVLLKEHWLKEYV